MSRVLALTAREHRAGTLDAWLANRSGGMERAGISPSNALRENGSTNLTLDELTSLLGVRSTSASGVAVTPESAMRVATVYACVSLISGAISSLPFGIFERVGNSRSEAEHDYWWMLNESANEEMTAATAWEYMVAARLFYGDAYARLLRPSPRSNRVIGWEPLHPLSVTPFRDTDGRRYYRYQPDRGAQIVLDTGDVAHHPSLGFDGLTSPSPITYAAREAIGVALAGENYSAKFFVDGGSFDYALKTVATVTKDQLTALKGSLMARTQYGGSTRSPLILTGGLEPAQLSVNPKDAEVLQTRLFSVEEICRIFGVPPHMAGHTGKSTSWGTGLAEQGSNFVRYCLRRHLAPIAQEWNRKLWPVRQRYFVEHLTEALESGDQKARFEGYRIALGRAGERPWMDVDEIRRKERMAPNPSLAAAQPNGGTPAPAKETSGADGPARTNEEVAE